MYIYIYIFDQGEIKCVVLEKKKKKLYSIYIYTIVKKKDPYNQQIYFLGFLSPEWLI